MRFSIGYAHKIHYHKSETSKTQMKAMGSGVKFTDEIFLDLSFERRKIRP